MNKIVSKLFDFNEDGNIFNESFWIYKEEDKEDYLDMFEAWMDAQDMNEEQMEEFSKHIDIFALGGIDGGVYAFWYKDAVPIENAPIIYINEGIFLIASDIKKFLQLFTFSVQHSEGKFVQYYYNCTLEEHFEEFIQEYPQFIEFRKWLKKELSIEPIEDWKVKESSIANNIHNEVIELYQDDFNSWQSIYYSI